MTGNGRCSLSARIAEAGNTQHHFALGALAARGFTVVIRPQRDDEYWAIHRDGTSLIGSSPLVLLGLLSLLDQLGEEWYQAPRVRFPNAEIVDLTLDGIDRISAAEVPAASAALQLLGRILDREIPISTTREELAGAVQAWLEDTAREDE